MSKPAASKLAGLLRHRTNKKNLKAYEEHIQKLANEKKGEHIPTDDKKE